MRRSPVLAGVLALALPLTAASPAAACLNGVEPEVVADSADTRRSEGLLRSGHLRRAVRLAGPALDRVKRRARTDPRRVELEPRLVRVLAVATVRLDGQVERTRWRPADGVSPAARRENLGWALDALAGLARRGSPIDRALHGEALVARGDHAAAERVLAPLAREDLMPDAYGYAALARAQHGLGRLDEARRTERTCRALAPRERGGICPALGSS